MPQFSAIAQYYHLLFPARPAQLKFLAALAGPPPARIFDVASGTGEYAAALHAQGYDCFGIDLDLAMHDCAKARHPALAARERLLQGDMLELTDLVRGPARLAYCIGNSLPQLDGDAQLSEALLQMWELTRPGGCVALQVVNFERIMSGGAALPALQAVAEGGAGIVLERSYDLRGLPQRVVFQTRLTHPGGVDEGQSALLCLTRKRLGAALPGAAQVEWYGDFAGAPWSAEAPATVCVLR
jgi:glycine/sarcosine N-methyltransferase